MKILKNKIVFIVVLVLIVVGLSVFIKYKLDTKNEISPAQYYSSIVADTNDAQNVLINCIYDGDVKCVNNTANKLVTLNSELINKLDSYKWPSNLNNNIYTMKNIITIVINYDIQFANAKEKEQIFEIGRRFLNDLEMKKNSENVAEIRNKLGLGEDPVKIGFSRTDVNN
jgi:hypothetical protein